MKQQPPQASSSGYADDQQLLLSRLPTHANEARRTVPWHPALTNICSFRVEADNMYNLYNKLMDLMRTLKVSEAWHVCQRLLNLPDMNSPASNDNCMTRQDPKDDKFPDLALSDDAQLVLTGDQGLLKLHPFHGIEIMKPERFTRLINQVKSEITL